MKQKQWFTVVITLLAALALSLSVFAAPNTGTAPSTGDGPLSGLESMLDTLESDLLPGNPEDGTVTSDDAVTLPETSAATTPSAGSETTGGMADDGGSAVGLVIGICIAVIVLILVFVILSRNSEAKGKK